jgi:hypothetical protein
VEFVALLPVLVGLAFALWQAVVAGHAAWALGGAARVAARAAAVGADPEAAARRVLPAALARTVRVRVARDGRVTVEARIPAVVPGPALPTIGASARFARQ